MATTLPAMAAQHVLVLGLGHSGLAMARWCAQAGALVTVWDSRETPPQAAALAAQCPGVQQRHGALDAQCLEGVDWVLKSPGLAPHDARIEPVLTLARSRGLKVGGEIDLFNAALQALQQAQGYAPQVLAITGTNGKTTTTAMTALLVARAGRRVAAAGNIGPTLLDTLRECLDAGALPEVWVLELSSFQLHDALDFEPTAAAVLNLSQDHLDWHGSMTAYAQAKARVFGRAALRVINDDDPAVVTLGVPVPAAPERPGPRPKGGGRAAPAVVRFGLKPPRQPGDFGLVEEGGMAWLVRALPDGDTPTRRRQGPEAAPLSVVLQRLMPVDALRVRGRHNAANALAALALATAIGCPLAPMLHGLREYAGEPHRVQSVGVVDGIEAFDDSKGTNVGATVAALLGLGADRAPARIALILGGDGKGQDFAPLAGPVARHARAVALIGRDAAAIESALCAHEGAAAIPRAHRESLEQAVQWCFAQARSGDAVLLSPACASFDMFRDYGHRAEVFAQAVREAALAHGGVA